MIINPIFAQKDLQSAMNSLLEYYNPNSLKTKEKCNHFMSDIKGNRFIFPIEKELAQEFFKEEYKYYGYIFPGKIIIDNENFIGLTYKILCSAGGHCEFDKLAILNIRNGELISNFEYGKYLSDNSGSLVKENVYCSDSLMIFKTSDIDLNPQDDSISSIKIDMQTIRISARGKINIISLNEINMKRKFYWISTDLVKDSTLAKQSKSELVEMRNEIFASYGYFFKSEKWRNYFESEDWYEAQFENVNESLTVIERMNIQKILNYEQLESNWQKYKNQNINFEIQYPINWYLKVDSLSIKKHNYLDRISIENMKEKVIVAGGGPFTENGSFFNISVLITSQGNTIKELIINGDLPERVKKQRLKQMLEREIGGIKTIVCEGSGWADKGYDFIYRGRMFKIHFMSGSKEQFEKDLPVFEKILESFKIIK